MSDLSFSAIPSYWAKLRSEIQSMQVQNIIHPPREVESESDVTPTLERLDHLFAAIAAQDITSDYPDLLNSLLANELPLLLSQLSPKYFPALLDPIGTRLANRVKTVDQASFHAPSLQQLVFAIDFAVHTFSSDDLTPSDAAKVICDLGVAIGLASLSVNSLPDMASDYRDLLELHKAMERFVNVRNECLALQAKLWLHSGGLIYAACAKAK